MKIKEENKMFLAMIGIIIVLSTIIFGFSYLGYKYMNIENKNNTVDYIELNVGDEFYFTSHDFIVYSGNYVITHIVKTGDYGLSIPLNIKYVNEPFKIGKYYYVQKYADSYKVIIERVN